MALPVRIKKEKDFTLLFNKGKRFYSESLTLIYYPAKDLRVGFVVSKKHGTSVKRNRIKRLLRDSFRSFVPKLSKNFFFVLLPKVNIEHSLQKFNQDLEYMLKKGKFFDD